jgi:hypothetical protein
VGWTNAPAARWLSQLKSGAETDAVGESGSGMSRRAISRGSEDFEQKLITLLRVQGNFIAKAAIAILSWRSRASQPVTIRFVPGVFSDAASNPAPARVSPHFVPVRVCARMKSRVVVRAARPCAPTPRARSAELTD